MTTSEDFTLDIPCPVCGKHEFSNISYKDGYTKTVFWCLTDRLNYPHQCTGRVCYCKKCEKYYPESGFGFHNDAYECKECGTVQWELTDINKESQRQEEILRRVRMNMMEF